MSWQAGHPDALAASALEGRRGIPGQQLERVMHRAIVFRARQPRPATRPSTVDPFAHYRFFFNRRLLSLGYEYVITDEQGRELMLVVKRLFSLVLHVDVYADEDCRQRLLTVRQDRPFQLLWNDYTIYDGAGVQIGTVRREPMMGRIFWGALLRSRLTVSDADLKPVAVAEPEYDVLIVNWRIATSDGAMLGVWQRRITLTEKHVLDLSADIMRSFDRRLAVALGVLLDFVCRG